MNEFLATVRAIPDRCTIHHPNVAGLNAQISGGTPSAESDCSACFGRGFTYGPTNAYPITEAQEEPERLDCPKCHGTGKNKGNK